MCAASSAGVTHGTSSSLQAGVPAISSQAGSKSAAAAASNPNSFAKCIGRLGAGDMTCSHAPAVSPSASTSIAQQLVGSDVQLADKPILGSAALQPWDKQTSEDNASQADTASAGDLSAATHRGSCCASVATSACGTKIPVGDSYRSSDSVVENVAEADRATSAFSRAASPPLFFEGEVGEDSLVDFGATEGSNGACNVTAVSQHEESTASSLVEADAQRQKAVSNRHQCANARGSGVGAQATSQQQQQQHLGLSCTAASGVHIQPNAPPGPQALLLCSKKQAQAVAHDAAAAATPPRLVLQPASGKLLNAQQVEVPGDAAAAPAQLVKDSASGREARAAIPSVARNSGSKENEEVGMARVVRRAANAHSRLDRPTVLQPTKPTTSSKVTRVPFHCHRISGSSCIICSRLHIHIAHWSIFQMSMSTCPGAFHRCLQRLGIIPCT